VLEGADQKQVLVPNMLLRRKKNEHLGERELDCELRRLDAWFKSCCFSLRSLEEFLKKFLSCSSELFSYNSNL